MDKAIFNVEEYERIYGPIETWDCEAYENSKRKKLRQQRKKKALLRKQRVLSYIFFLLAFICALMLKAIPEIGWVLLANGALGIIIGTSDEVLIYDKDKGERT